MKGPNVDDELKVASKQFAGKFELHQDIAYTLPNTSHQRRLIVYKKVASAND